MRHIRDRCMHRSPVGCMHPTVQSMTTTTLPSFPPAAKRA